MQQTVMDNSDFSDEILTCFKDNISPHITTDITKFLLAIDDRNKRSISISTTDINTNTFNLIEIERRVTSLFGSVIVEVEKVKLMVSKQNGQFHGDYKVNIETYVEDLNGQMVDNSRCTHEENIRYVNGKRHGQHTVRTVGKWGKVDAKSIMYTDGATVKCKYVYPLQH
jgi:DNA mismatch repair ATPase MutS